MYNIFVYICMYIYPCTRSFTSLYIVDLGSYRIRQSSQVSLDCKLSEKLKSYNNEQRQFLALKHQLQDKLLIHLGH